MPGWSQFVGLIESGLQLIADTTGSAGLSIIIFTIIIKTILLPLTVKSVRSSVAMQELQPKIKDLQKRYGKDRQRLSAETMKLYQEHGINPAAGCLPMLLQIPIFFALYFAVRDLSESGVGAWGQGFLWIPNLAEPDPLFILPILAGIFQFIQTKMTRPAGMGKAADPQQQMMYTIMMFMPIMVVIFGWTFAAGPVLYWVAQAVYSVIQQWFITGWGSLLDWFPFLPNLPEHRRLGYQSPEQRKAAAAKGGGGLFARMQKQLEAQQAKIEAERQSNSETTDGSGESSERREKVAAQNGRRQKTQESETSSPAPRPDLVPRRTRSSKRRRSAEGD